MSIQSRLGWMTAVRGTAFFVWPHASLLVMLYSLAGWAALAGALEIMAAIELRVLTDYH